MTAVPAAAAYSQSPFWGIKLSRDEALAHPRIDEFWEIVDYVLLTDPVVHAHVYGHELNTLAGTGPISVPVILENGTTSSRQMSTFAIRAAMYIYGSAVRPIGSQPGL